MTGMCMSINHTSALLDLHSLPLTTKLSEQMDRVRRGLTEHTAQSKTSHSKVERNSTHMHHWLWKLKMHVHVLLWLDFMFQRSKFGSDTLTFPLHTFFIPCLWLTQPPERKTSQHAALSQLMRMVPQHEAVFCSYYTDPSFLNRMHVLRWSTFVTVSAFSKLIRNDTRCHCKKRHVEVLSCTPIKQIFSVPLCHVTCVELTAKTSNVPGTVISQIDDGPSSLQAKYCHWKKVCFFCQQSVKSCETQHNHNWMAAIYVDKLNSFSYISWSSS